MNQAMYCDTIGKLNVHVQVIGGAHIILNIRVSCTLQSDRQACSQN